MTEEQSPREQPPTPVDPLLLVLALLRQNAPIYHVMAGWVRGGPTVRITHDNGTDTARVEIEVPCKPAQYADLIRIAHDPLLNIDALQVSGIATGPARTLADLVLATESPAVPA